MKATSVTLLKILLAARAGQPGTHLNLTPQQALIDYHQRSIVPEKMLIKTLSENMLARSRVSIRMI